MRVLSLTLDPYPHSWSELTVYQGVMAVYWVDHLILAFKVTGERTFPKSMKIKDFELTINGSITNFLGKFD
jgi:hypothetical protein